MPHDPQNPAPADTHFDASEALQQLSSDLALDGIAAPRPRPRPAFVDQFVAIVRTKPCGTNATADYTDARYYLDRAAPQAGSSSGAVLSAQADNLPGVKQCLTATNLAELSTGSHLLAAGTVVQVAALYTRSGAKLYVFNQPPPGGAVVQITGASGGGKYTGSILTGASSAASSGTLAMPEGMRAGPGALILNQEEDGQTGHRLKVPCYAVGQIVGVSKGLTVVMIRGALGATGGPTSLAGSGLSPDSTTWSRSSDGTPVLITLQARTFWDSTGGVLYAYQRNLTFDARGLLVSVSAETQVTVDVPTACQ